LQIRIENIEISYQTEFQLGWKKIWPKNVKNRISRFLATGAFFFRKSIFRGQIFFSICFLQCHEDFIVGFCRNSIPFPKKIKSGFVKNEVFWNFDLKDVSETLFVCLNVDLITLISNLQTLFDLDIPFESYTIFQVLGTFWKSQKRNFFPWYLYRCFICFPTN
jgi:hypothetical protein